MTENNWKLVDAFFDKYDLVDHHIKSYNDFVNNRIQNIIDITEPITLDDGKYTLKTGKVRIEKPSNKEADGSRSEIDPTEARLRNLNYSADMYLEMALNEDGEENELEEVYIGELPVMLKSDICHLNGLSPEELIEKHEDPQDLGGYFIVNGSERAVVTMEEIAPNKIILERLDEPEDRHAKAVVTSIKSGFRARITLEYKKLLESYTEIPIIMYDERLTSVISNNVLIEADVSRKKRKKKVDGMAAVIILQGYLDRFR